jgi:hypothetical protein
VLGPVVAAVFTALVESYQLSADDEAVASAAPDPAPATAPPPAPVEPPSDEPKSQK